MYCTIESTQKGKAYVIDQSPTFDEALAKFNAVKLDYINSGYEVSDLNGDRFEVTKDGQAFLTYRLYLMQDIDPNEA